MPVTGDARRRSRRLFGVLALSALALLAGPPSIAMAETKVVTVPGTIVSQWKFNPNNELQCSALSFVKWKDPDYKVSEKFPIAWQAFYTASGEERSISGTPPFDDLITFLGATYAVGGNSHWLNVGFASRVGAGAADGCEDLRDAQETALSGPARVEITFELKDPPVNKKKCAAARADLRKANKAVGKLLGKLRRADSADEKSRIREQLAKAKDKRADAAQKVDKVCT